MPQAKKQLISLQRRQQLLYIGMFSLVTVMVWVAVNLFQSQKSTQIPATLKKKAQPLTPSINQQVIQEVEAKRSFSSEELSNFPIYKLILTREGGEELVTIDTPEPNLRQATPEPSPSPAPEATTTPEATQSSQVAPEPTPEATPEGTASATPQ